MQINRRRLVHLAGLALAVAAVPAWAQDKWPSKPITYIVPFPAGGTTDTLARLIGQKLGPALGTTIVVDNKGGAGGSVGSELAARAPADGYTILGGTISSHSINVSLYPKLGYDPVKDFVPVTLIGTNPLLLVVKAESPYKTVQDLVAAAKSKPLNAASAGNGTSQHLALELFKFKLGLNNVTHVPYKGSGPAIQDTIAGQVDAMFDTTVAAAPHIESGRLRAIAVTSNERLKSMPNVPTIAETVLPGFSVTSWQAIFAPAATPKPIVQRLHDEIGKVLAMPDTQERLLKLGMDPSRMTPDQVGAFQKEEIAKWAQVIKAANIKAE